MRTSLPNEGRVGGRLQPRFGLFRTSTWVGSPGRGPEGGQGGGSKQRKLCSSREARAEEMTCILGANVWNVPFLGSGRRRVDVGNCVVRKYRYK